MKIMITGGAGFVGSHLAEYLLKKRHKIVICTKTSVKNVDSIREKIELEKIDVTNYAKLEKFIIKKKPDVIIHLAGNTSHSKSFESPFNDLDSNTKSTLNILEIIKKTLPKSYIAYYSENAYRVEFISSFSMLGMKIKMDGLQINNYNQLKSLTMVSMIAEKGKQAKDTTDHTLEDIFIDTISN